MLQTRTVTAHGSHRAAAEQLHRDREEMTGVENFKKTDVVSLRMARCREEGRQFKYGDRRDVHRLSEGQGQKEKRAQS